MSRYEVWFQVWLPVLGVIVLVVLAGPLKRWLSGWAARKGREKGMNYGERAADRVAAREIEKSVQKVGRTLVFPDALAGQGVVDRLLDATKYVTRVDVRTWDVGFVYPDDLTIEYRTEATGGTLAVVRARQTMGSLNGEGRWSGLLRKIGKAAAEAGTVVQQGSVQLVLTDEVVKKDRVWRSAPASDAASTPGDS
ncbi:MAG TPA: hypothetical protein VGC67_11490 [Cellulomonas sp.]